MIDKSVLLTWLAAGEYEKTISSLVRLVNTLDDPTLQSEAILQSSRYSSLMYDRRMGIIDETTFNVQRNQIGVALEHMIQRIPVKANIQVLGEPVVNQALPLQVGTIAPTSAHLPWMLGLLLLVGSAIGLVGFLPCPTPQVESLFNLLMALGAGGIATVLPGAFHFEFKYVKAGSAAGVFVLVYLVNPAGAVRNDERCNKMPFEFTISLSPDKSTPTPPSYPKLEDALLQIRLDNKWEPSEVYADGDAHYRSIAGDFKNRRVGARLVARYWKLAQDSVELRGKSQTLTVVPDGSLGRLEGRVMDASTGAGLEGAAVDISGLTALTTTGGNFRLDIPVDKQHEEYDVDIFLKGYKPFRGHATPATGAPLRVLLTK